MSFTVNKNMKMYYINIQKDDIKLKNLLEMTLVWK